MKKFAFWEYDLFPYLLGSEVTSDEKITNGEVSYYSKSYQAYITPKFVLPVKEGQELLNKLHALREEKRKADKETHIKFRGRLSDLLKDFNVKCDLS